MINPPTLKARDVKTQFIEVLKKDHNFDIIEEMVAEIKMIKRAKKIKPMDKRRLLKDYYLAILSYVVPKQKVIDDGRVGIGDNIQFNINIGGDSVPGPGACASPAGSNRKSPINITIPAKKSASGSYVVDMDDVDSSE